MLIRKLGISICLFCVGMQFGFAKSRVIIHCDEAGAVLYVNGAERLQIKEKMTPVFLSSGHYELMVSKPLDEDWQLVGRKNITLADDHDIDAKMEMNIEKISKKHNKSSAENFQKMANVVEDKAAKRIWQDDNAVTHLKKNWKDAQAYCRALDIDGVDGWRLPSYDELISIVDYSKHTLAIMPAFKHIVSEYYWSSTVDTDNKNSIKSIYFGNGCPDGKSKNNLFYIRCVRTLK